MGHCTCTLYSMFCNISKKGGFGGEQKVESMKLFAWGVGRGVVDTGVGESAKVEKMKAHSPSMETN